MSSTERVRILRTTRELGRFSDAQLNALLPHIDELCVRAGERLAWEGRLCHQFLIVASGRLETCRQGLAGTLGPGDTFGWRAMHDRGLNDASVQATTAAHILVMSHDQFRAVDALAA